MLKAYGESVTKKQMSTNGISVSKMTVETLKMANPSDATPHQEPMQT